MNVLSQDVPAGIIVIIHGRMMSAAGVGKSLEKPSETIPTRSQIRLTLHVDRTGVCVYLCA